MACAIGYYKTNRGNNENCTKCNDGLLTSNMASTAVTDCNQRKTHYFQEYLEGFFLFLLGCGGSDNCEFEKGWIILKIAWFFSKSNTEYDLFPY